MLVVRVKGVEPSRGCPHMDLNHARLPFRHTRVRESEWYHRGGNRRKGRDWGSAPCGATPINPLFRRLEKKGMLAEVLGGQGYSPTGLLPAQVQIGVVKSPTSPDEWT